MWLAGGGRSLTCRILLADEAHQLHEGHGDALLVQVVFSCHGRPVTRRVQPLLVLHLPHLWVVPHVSTDGEGAGLGFRVRAFTFSWLEMGVKGRGSLCWLLRVISCMGPLISGKQQEVLFSVQ